MGFIDGNGYIRGDPAKTDLISRQVAYEKIYLRHRERYPLPFSSYVVHHRDRDKLNNSIPNLDIVTKEEHEQIHKLGLKGKSELDTWRAKNENKILVLKEEIAYESSSSKQDITSSHQSNNNKKIKSNKSRIPIKRVSVPKKKVYTRANFYGLTYDPVMKPFQDTTQRAKLKDPEKIIKLTIFTIIFLAILIIILAYNSQAKLSEEKVARICKDHCMKEFSIDTWQTVGNANTCHFGIYICDCAEKIEDSSHIFTNIDIYGGKIISDPVKIENIRKEQGMKEECW